ncbi:MAG: GMC family oxidoreductase [Sporichthyaceae bacterium]
MSAEEFDFVIVGAGSAGAVIAARLTEDPDCRVLLLEAGGVPPAVEAVPAAAPAMWCNPATDWSFTGDPGKAGLGLIGRRVMANRGRMLGGTSGINFMAYVRGNPADYDSWAAGGATGWSYADVLPYFRKSEGLVPSPDIDLDPEAHRHDGPLGVCVRAPVLEPARQFVEAAVAAGIPRGDYNGRDRGGPSGVSSLLQTSTRDGRRSSTYHAFLEPTVDRANLTVRTDVEVTRILLTDGAATGVEYATADGTLATVAAEREIVLSAGAFGTPHLLLRSGVGPAAELLAAGVECLVDSPHVGKHLKDHTQVLLFFPAPGVGISALEVGLALGPDALRAPAGPLPADPADDAGLPPELEGLRAEAERRIVEWATTGTGLASSSLYDAAAWFSTGLSMPHTHDGQIGFLVCGFTPDLWRLLNIDPTEYFDDPDTALSPLAENVVISANPVQPRSEGEVRLDLDPMGAPDIRFNFFDEQSDLQVAVAVIRRTLQVAANWPGPGLGPLHVPPALARAHGHSPGEEPSDELLADLVLHYSVTIYHPTSTCRMGDVVDPRLKVFGVSGLRIADASVMPDIVSGNTNAACIMIGEKAAELIAAEHGVKLAEFVGC